MANPDDAPPLTVSEVLRKPDDKALWDEFSKKASVHALNALFTKTYEDGRPDREAARYIAHELETALGMSERHDNRGTRGGIGYDQRQGGLSIVRTDDGDYTLTHTMPGAEISLSRIRSEIVTDFRVKFGADNDRAPTPEEIKTGTERQVNAALEAQASAALGNQNQIAGLVADKLNGVLQKIRGSEGIAFKPAVKADDYKTERKFLPPEETRALTLGSSVTLTPEQLGAFLQQAGMTEERRFIVSRGKMLTKGALAKIPSLKRHNLENALRLFDGADGTKPDFQISMSEYKAVKYFSADGTTKDDILGAALRDSPTGKDYKTDNYPLIATDFSGTFIDKMITRVQSHPTDKDFGGLGKQQPPKSPAPPKSSAVRMSADKER